MNKILSSRSDGKILIVAEAGINHNGDLGLAREMIDVAIEVGADVVKFQTANVEEVVTEKASLAPYQRNPLVKITTQLELLKKLHLRVEDFLELSEYCANRILFASTAFDIASLKYIANLAPAFIKVPSGEITNLPFLKAVGATSQKVVLSTGMSNLQEIQDALLVLNSAGTPLDMVTILHCTSSYPAPNSDLNLRAIQTIKTHFNCEVGYSDHSEGIVAPIIAASLGANIIEKHFSLNKNMEGPDHRSSIEPREFKDMVEMIRQTEVMLGHENKGLTRSEIPNIEIVRRSIVARGPIRRGDIFSETNLTTKRPGRGMSPMLWETLIGKSATKNYEKDDFIEEEI